MLQLEDGPVEAAHRWVLTSSNPSMSELMRHLAAEDDLHAATLRSFAERRALLAAAPPAVAP
jgi:hypothetical protein